MGSRVGDKCVEKGKKVWESWGNGKERGGDL